jgi:hypothetical protein
MSKSFLLALAGGLVIATISPAQEIKANTEFRVKLLAPLSTETNKKGDKFTAQVLSPQEFANAMMEGEVKDSKSGAKLKGTSVLYFSFETLHTQDADGSEKTRPVSTDVKSFVNSQGKANVDEEGRVIAKKNNLGKVAVATGAGAVIGGILGGGKGAAIGAGVGGAASLILIQMTVKAPNITFAAGSEFLLSVSERKR